MVPLAALSNFFRLPNHDPQGPKFLYVRRCEHGANTSLISNRTCISF